MYLYTLVPKQEITEDVFFAARRSDVKMLQWLKDNNFPCDPNTLLSRLIYAGIDNVKWWKDTYYSELCDNIDNGYCDIQIYPECASTGNIEMLEYLHVNFPPKRNSGFKLICSARENFIPWFKIPEETIPILERIYQSQVKDGVVIPRNGVPNKGNYIIHVEEINNNVLHKPCASEM